MGSLNDLLERASSSLSRRALSSIAALLCSACASGENARPTPRHAPPAVAATRPSAAIEAPSDGPIRATADALLEYLACRAFDAADAPQRRLYSADVVLVATISELRSQDLGGDRVLQTAMLDTVKPVSGDAGAQPMVAWIDQRSSGRHSSLTKGRRGVLFVRAVARGDDAALVAHAPNALTPASEPALVADDDGALAGALARWATPDEDAHARDGANRDAILKDGGVAFQIALADVARTHATPVLAEALPQASGVRALLIRAALFRAREQVAASRGLDVRTLPANVLASLGLHPVMVDGQLAGWTGPAETEPLGAPVPASN